MQKVTSEVTKIRRLVNAHVARLKFQGKLRDYVDKLPKELTDSWVTRYRCCEYKERAILAERIKLAMGVTGNDVPEGTRLSEVARMVEEGFRPEGPIISIIDTACDRCPIDKMIVTDACRNCVAHMCQNACPKNSIQILQNKAFIDQSTCVECGLCAQACPFNAIIKVDRPCERACELNAIKPGPKRNATIDEERCVSCGACTAACPFGAISERSDLLQVVGLLMRDEPVWALIAPSGVGQFGPAVTPAQLKAALLQLGFRAVLEVAQGADVVAAEEADELQERLAGGQAFMTSSCCPAFVELVQKHYPDVAANISHTPSPMVRAAQIARSKGAKHVVFIGPCLAKKAEAARVGRSTINAVLTFEELGALFVARDINVAEIETNVSVQDATSAGRGFAKAGGVASAVRVALSAKPDALPLQAFTAAGLPDCKMMLKKAAAGKPDGNFLEGMACVDGCMGGPGVMVRPQVAVRKLADFCAAADAKEKQSGA